jgi:hypothetical protein
MRSLQHSLHALKALFPGTDLELNSLPFFELDFAEHVALDDYDLVKLVNLGVDDIVLNRFNCPRFNIVSADLRKRG